MESSEPQAGAEQAQGRGLGSLRRRMPSRRQLVSTGRTLLLGPLAEVLLIGLWAAWFGRPLLDLDPFTWPVGREFGYQIEGHHFWTQLRACGLCALWDGGINGGAPALVDLFSSRLHPLVAIPTLIWGVIPGVKVSVVLALWMAGTAQLWIGRSLNLRRPARLWGAFLVVVAGHLAPRLELGSPGLVLSTAASSLTLAAAIDLAVTGRRRSALLLAVTATLAIVSGVGHLQFGLVAWAPAFLFLVVGRDFRPRPVIKEFVLAGVLALLLAGAVLVPVLHFFPNFWKFTDPGFPTAQPLQYIPVNLVVPDRDFMRAEVLGKYPFEYMYHLYVGWVPILLAILCLRFSHRKDEPILLCLLSGSALTLFFASAIPLRWLAGLIPALAGFRHSQLIAGLAIPGIVGLASYGLDKVLSLKWPRIALRLDADSPSKTLRISLVLVLAAPIILSVKSAYDLTRNFVSTIRADATYGYVEALRSPDLAWVSTPFGEHYWVEPSLAQGLKLTNVVAVWRWNERDVPEPMLIAERGAPVPGAEQVGVLQEGIPVSKMPGRFYAYVDIGDEIIPCRSSGTGGDLTIQCSTEAPGQLVVQENSWSGWRVFVDGSPARVIPGPWLSAEAPAGEHEFRFVYRPWDVIVGLVISGLGILLWLWLWWSSKSRKVLEPPPVA